MTILSDAGNMRFACRIAKARIHITQTQTHTLTHMLIIFSTYCFSMAIMVARTHLNVTLYVHCPSSNVILAIYAKVLQAVSFFQASPTKPGTHPPSQPCLPNDAPNSFSFI
jgi:hypothetical protein